MLRNILITFLFLQVCLSPLLMASDFGVKLIIRKKTKTNIHIFDYLEIKSFIDSFIANFKFRNKLGKFYQYRIIRGPDFYIKGKLIKNGVSIVIAEYWDPVNQFKTFEDMQNFIKDDKKNAKFILTMFSKRFKSKYVFELFSGNF